MHSLPLFIKLQDRPVILLGEGAAADAKRRLLERAGALVTGEEAQAALAIVAIDDEAEATQAVDRLKARGILINATDRPALCDFTLPAIIDRDPVLIAIGTGGKSAGLAKAVRQRIEALLPASLGGMAKALFEARPKIKARWPDAADRRRALDAGLASGGMLDPLRAPTEESVESWLSADARPAGQGLVRIVLASPDPDNLTLRNARLLGEADYIYYAPDISAAILCRARADAIITKSAFPPDEMRSGLTLWLQMGA